MENQIQYEQEDAKSKIEIKWSHFKDNIIAGNKEMPKQERRIPKQWMTQEILDQLTTRKTKKINNCINYEYKALYKQIQQKCKEAKEQWLRHKCRMVEIHGINSKAAHEEVKAMCNKRRKAINNSGIKDKNEKMLIDRTAGNVRQVVSIYRRVI